MIEYNSKTKRPILKLNSFKKDNTALSPENSKCIDVKEALANVVEPEKFATSPNTNHKTSSANAAPVPHFRYEEVLSHLQTHYPKCFPSMPETPLPLAIKIHEQLLAKKIPTFSNTAIRKFLAQYTRTKPYREAKKTITKRYNLDGSFASNIKHSDQQSHDNPYPNKGQVSLPHDSLFKRIMENGIAAKEFLDEYLPDEVKNILDLNTIKIQKESYIEPNLTKRLSDIVYAVDTKNHQQAFIYVLAEHQSSVDHLMPFRLWRYTLLLAERHIEDKNKLPLIFPLVVYAGETKYTAPRNLWALFDNPKLAKKLLTEDHGLVDLQATSDDDIAKKKHIALFEYILKHAQMRDMLALWKNLFEKLPNAVIMDKKHGYFYISNYFGI